MHAIYSTEMMRLTIYFGLWIE